MMRRGAGGAPGLAPPGPAPAPPPPPPPPRPPGDILLPPPPRGDEGGVRTEYDFVLPRSYVDDEGVVHREGTMRLATARDELLPLYDGRVRERPEWLSVVLLSRVLTRLGTITDVTDRVIEHLFASDLAFL